MLCFFCVCRYDERLELLRCHKHSPTKLFRSGCRRDRFVGRDTRTVKKINIGLPSIGIGVLNQETIENDPVAKMMQDIAAQVLEEKLSKMEKNGGLQSENSGVKKLIVRPSDVLKGASL